MANLREIRRRIAGIRSTSKITQAMKLVAAAKLRRAQDAMIAARPYAGHLRALMAHMLSRVDSASLPLWFRQDAGKGVLIVIVTADRGLCGSFNTNIIRTAAQLVHGDFSALHAEGKVKLLTVGRRAFQYFSKRDYPVTAAFNGVVNDPDPGLAAGIVTRILDGYAAGEYDRVELVFNEFKSVIQQNLRVETLLPMPAEPEPLMEFQGHEYHEFIDYIYEPSEQALMEALVPKHLNFQLLRVMLESNAAEQGARMSAMDAATANAKELIHTLQLEYNSARQASITKEILEIVGGAEALKKGG